MSEGLTKSSARNIFFGGTIFFLVILVALTVHSYGYIQKTSTDVAAITSGVKHGKAVWERNSCINCHTILGEGAYYAPELGNVWTRYGGRDDAEVAREGIKSWIENQPTGIEGRRQMPNFNLNDDELNALVDFFKWVDTIKNQDWPPNDAG